MPTKRNIAVVLFDAIQRAIMACQWAESRPSLSSSERRKLEALRDELTKQRSFAREVNAGEHVLLTKSEIARRKRCHPEYVTEWARTNSVPPVDSAGKKLGLYDLAAFARLNVQPDKPTPSRRRLKRR